jgi:hypothetical protein
MIEVDETLWPLLLMRYAAPLSLEDFEEVNRKMTAMLERQEPYVAIVDGRKGQGMTPEQRQLQADWLKRNDPALRKYCLGTAFIITSAIGRLTLNVMIILKPPPIPYTVVPTLEAAAVWAADRLAAAGLSLHAQRVRGAYGPKARVK